MYFNPLYCVYCKFSIPQRYMIAIMLNFGLMHTFAQRVALNLAITEMLEPKHEEMNHLDSCPNYNYSIVENIKGGKFKWDHHTEALILYAFYIGYIIGQVPGGRLADRYGIRHVFGLGTFTGVIITSIFPFAIDLGGEWAAVVLRIILGLVQSPTFPAVSTMLQNWIPKEERGFAGGLAFTGSNLGIILGNIVTGWLIKQFQSWRLPFYVWGVAGLIWYIIFLFTVFSYPHTHPFVTDEERLYLDDRLKASMDMKPPWRQIFRSKSLYALIAGAIAHDYIILTLITDLPKFMNNILKMNVSANSVSTALPFVCIWISSHFFSYLADVCVNREYLSLLMVRRIWTCAAAVIPGGILVGAVYVGCNRVLVIVLCCLAVLVHGCAYAGIRVNVSDLTHNHGGSLMAIVNGISGITGIVGPMLVGLLTPNHTLEEWHIVFWIMFGVEIFFSIIYWVFASADRALWDYASAMEIL